MSVRKRTWNTARGELKEAFIVDYFDAAGKRRHESFATQAEAKRRHAQVTLDISKGTVLIDRKVTIGTVATEFLNHKGTEDRERGTLAMYEQHLRLHILPVMGRVKLGKLNTDTVESFRRHLLAENAEGEPALSRAMARKVWVTFKSLLKHARMAHIAQGVTGIPANKRGKRKLEIGVHVPTNEEIKRLYEATRGNEPKQKRLRALLLVAAFCGLRASELRGLRWDDVNLDDAELQVTQRADHYGRIGHPKSESSRRHVPLSPDVVHAMREWRMAQPGGFGLVFANSAGAIDSHGNMLRAWRPVMKAAGLVDKQGNPRYAMHAFRHYFASWCISPKDRGGRGLSPKIAQEWLGHATIAMTLDTYGHLFKEVDQSELAASTASVLH
jgi:integrase